MKIHIYHHFDDQDAKIDRLIILVKTLSNKIDMLMEDPTGLKKQEIMDKLDTIIEDIKQTV